MFLIYMKLVDRRILRLLNWELFSRAIVEPAAAYIDGRATIVGSLFIDRLQEFALHRIIPIYFLISNSVFIWGPLIQPVIPSLLLPAAAEVDPQSSLCASVNYNAV